jgi:Cof subfamily protein (haloacid dehalogenase superfamily)
MIKAIFLDIDGTLVSFETHRIPDSAVQALSRAKANGIRVFIATGRPKIIINNLQQLDERNIIDGYVSMNGAYCFVGDHIIYSRSISAESVNAIADYVERMKVPCTFVSATDIRVCYPDKLVEDIFYGYLHINRIPIVSTDEVRKYDTYQISAFISSDEEAILLKDLDDCSGDRWHPAFTDIIAAGCDKGRGVQLINDYFGFTKDEVMCFGDGGNDISMLQHAAIGIAMGNATEDVKKEANYVTTSVDEDGIQNALQHFNLI